jgi:hypothetical protein
MQYWLDLFTGTTWDEFRAAGSTCTGFRQRMRRLVAKVQRGDILLCYLTGVMRWVGALEVVGPSKDKRAIWKDEQFPERLEVQPVVLLDAKHGVPMTELEGKVCFYRGPNDRGKFVGFVRRSPNQFQDAKDGELVLELLKKAEAAPVERRVDPKKYARKPLYKAEQRKGKKTLTAVVSVPESEEKPDTVGPTIAAPIDRQAATKHTEIQYNLLALGQAMGFDVWVARNDRSKNWDGKMLGTLAGAVAELPTQFNEATNRTIELIDVLWLKGNSIVAAFEVESTTAIYSGLLRMSDLLALQPNLEIRLFLVAPDDRRDKVEQEILRPTFELSEKPLAKVCGFIGFSTLLEKLEGIRRLGLETSLKPEFLHRIAEYFGSESAES